MRGYRGDEDEGEDEDERTNRWTDRKMIRGSLVLYVTSVIRCVGVCVRLRVSYGKDSTGSE